MQKFNFKDIFSGDKINVQKIIIPIIQRDYAQGRNTATIKRVRKNFLNALFDAVTNKPITLDFIYGDLNDAGILTPLDGQQRLTTLFLLYWYAAKKENISAAEYDFLKNFSYETRPDTRDFCAELINFQPQFQEKLSEEIQDQAWFPLSWKKDSSISAMLEMLDAINEKFSAVQNIWQRLEDNAISFYFLPIKDMGLTDEIYITMNSRGKQLTDFEHFKAEFKSRLDNFDAEISNRIILKIDTVWTDMLWQYRDKNNLIDSGFLNYFKFLCNILLYKKNDTPQNKKRESFFDLLDEFFSGNIQENINFMEKAFDCWCKIDIGKFFEERVSRGSKSKKFENQSQAWKIILYFDNANLFEDCVKSAGKNFSLGKTVMLYAFVVYLLNRDKISEKDFRRRIRIINNLVNNSVSSELSDSESRQGGNRLPAILKQIDSILINEKILVLGPNFNDYQLKEEQQKLEWTTQNPNFAESLFELEDHYLLYGQIVIVGLDTQKYFKRFISLFKCDYDLIDCALLVRFDYFQNKNKIYQFGAKKEISWQNLFHYSSYNENFENTQLALDTLLSEQTNFTDSYLEKIIAEHLADCERQKIFEWSYYYIKYKEFRPARYGKYFWQNFSDTPYLFFALWTEQRWSENAYQPFLRAIVDEKTFAEKYNSSLVRLEFGKYFVACENDAYVVKKIENEETVDKLKINQRGGVDTEDRILKFKNWDFRRNLF